MVTIGVGDDQTLDGAFVSGCDFSFLTTRVPGYLSADIGSIISLVQNLEPKFHSMHRQVPCVFIGSSSESSDISIKLRVELNKTIIKDKNV